MEDRTLIEMAVAGRAECFSILMERYKTVVTNCIGAMVRDRSDVEDLVQDTFLKAWLKLATFRFEASFRTWITRVALNEALALHRRRRRRPFCQGQTDFENFRCPVEAPDETLVRSEVQRTLHRAIGSLPYKYREVLILCDLKQMSSKETARHLKASIALVKTRLFRARRMLSLALNSEIAA
jgi:RNA polymerase sigma-70 factor, ECF subfamily